MTTSPVTPMTARQLAQQNETGRPTFSPNNPFQPPQTPGTPMPGYGLGPAFMTYDIWCPFPAHAAGQAAYAKEVQEWCRKYGGTRATMNNPFPLWAGGAYLDSRECYQCGMRGHVGATCQEPEERHLPNEERGWRADYEAICIAQRVAEKADQVAPIEEVAEGGKCRRVTVNEAMTSLQSGRETSGWIETAGEGG
ncbi:hypothetical protein M422DRAFT_48036 [Sphaerobolus stellatus SS14]|uniref:CCHC-type domain-containing protein n=1 Tax=Sphaerobolus stellatus (strain SS14) TaxID=990650 RepID=A0A0C9V7M5_SPHS4|nr:hypothetical protein M422DRAFT_48036 [Sphaerobolus stellatus SS14]